MAATVELNPYEREIQYGYPYVIGHRDGKAIRGPLLTIPVSVDTSGRELVVQPDDEIVRFNSLPFRTQWITDAQERSLARLIEQPPAYPAADGEVRSLCEVLARDFLVELRGDLGGDLKPPPEQPRSGSWLALIDAAACFVAPKTSYFLASDLEAIGRDDGEPLMSTAIAALFGDRGAEPTSDVFSDSMDVVFPFPSNPSQRRVALLADEPSNRIITVQGPPGTGKSQTIANVASHLVARGKRVLISSQKDQALVVVDQMLQTLNMPQLPMTLLRHDRDSRRELRERLEGIRKERSSVDTAAHLLRSEKALVTQVSTVEDSSSRLDAALLSEHRIAEAERALGGATSWLVRLKAKRRLRRAHRLGAKQAPVSSDVLGEQATEARQALFDAAIGVLGVAGDHRVAAATKDAQRQLREFARLLARNQSSYKNFRIFDRLKAEPERCEMLLRILPCWIVSPDDVARLFPCTPGLFDTVIIDEASQCDLPSMTPVLYRAKQAIIAGDSKQMQAQRFAFTSEQVAVQAWYEQGMDRFDPDRWLDPSRVDLLQLASIRRDEEAFLDEHYRSLPPIISFSNHRWYRDSLRIMRDIDDRRVGDPDDPVVQLHRVEEGIVTAGTQENEAEALAVVQFLEKLLHDPMYARASVGVICLFEEQMRLVAELIAERIDEETRADHALVVVNPDGFQGDERDVVVYSLSYDARNMTQQQISQRQAEREHIQGMLNVGFTRARDEMHIFLSAAPEDFGMASGRGAIREWLEHCAIAQAAHRRHTVTDGKASDSEFEAEVGAALQARGLRIAAQYPCCGFRIDLVASRAESRVAVECDGELWHLDENGHLRLEDLQRQEILERAGWRVVRIPYRAWRRNPEAQIDRVLRAMDELESPEPDEDAGVPALDSEVNGEERIQLPRYEAAILSAVKAGVHEHDAVLRRARELAGHGRLGAIIRVSLEQATATLVRRGLVALEDGEIFATDRGRAVTVEVLPLMVSTRDRSSRPRQRRPGTPYRGGYRGRRW